MYVSKTNWTMLKKNSQKIYRFSCQKCLIRIQIRPGQKVSKPTGSRSESHWFVERLQNWKNHHRSSWTYHDCLYCTRTVYIIWEVSIVGVLSGLLFTDMQSCILTTICQNNLNVPHPELNMSRRLIPILSVFGHLHCLSFTSCSYLSSATTDWKMKH